MAVAAAATSRYRRRDRSTEEEWDEMMCGLVVRRLKPGSYEEFRRAWEPLNDDEWPRGMTRLWIGRSDDDPDVVATWGVFELDADGLDALRDDPAWMAAESQRMQRMAEYEEELVISSFFEITEEVIPPAARTS
jgi:hypothetical protein